VLHFGRSSIYTGPGCLGDSDHPTSARPARFYSVWKLCNSICNCRNRSSSSLVISDRIGATVPEHELQTFLAEHPEIFEALGYSKIYPHLVLERDDGSELIPDFMLEPIYDKWWDILDIKVPEKPTIVGTPDRQRFSADVSELVAQLREYGAAFEDPNLARRVEEKYGVKCYRPKLIGIIGRDDPRNADEHELGRLMTSYTDTRVLTFDQLLRKAKSRLLI
jgi:hypothetical protein